MRLTVCLAGTRIFPTRGGAEVRRFLVGCVIPCEGAPLKPRKSTAFVTKKALFRKRKFCSRFFFVKLHSILNKKRCGFIGQNLCNTLWQLFKTPRNRVFC